MQNKCSAFYLCFGIQSKIIVIEKEEGFGLKYEREIRGLSLQDTQTTITTEAQNFIITSNRRKLPSSSILPVHLLFGQPTFLLPVGIFAHVLGNACIVHSQ
jgi:hypothetical protein